MHRRDADTDVEARGLEVVRDAREDDALQDEADVDAEDAAAAEQVEADAVGLGLARVVAVLQPLAFVDCLRRRSSLLRCRA